MYEKEAVMKKFIGGVVTALVLAGGLVAAGEVTAAATTATGAPKVLAGTVEIDTTQIALLVSGKMGGGVLEYQGKDHAFSIGGLGVGGIGVQKVRAVGAVYNLTDISKFAGTYVQARAGATLGTGKNVMSLSNKHGVIMELKASTEGAALSVGVDGLVVTMK
jgi:hypothetical protein